MKLFIHDMIFCVEIPKKSFKRVELINEFSMLKEYEINM